MADDTYYGGSSRRHRPTKRVTQGEESSGEASVLAPPLYGVAAAYGNTLLFFGYPVNGKVEVVVYPRYRFSSDDRVQGQLGTLWFPEGTPLETAMLEADRLYDLAQENYRLAVTSRSSELRAHGARYEAAYDTITDLLRESWHGFALRLSREGSFGKDGVWFEGNPPDPVLARWRGECYTLWVAPTGSIMLLTGDERASLTRRLPKSR